MTAHGRASLSGFEAIGLWILAIAAAVAIGTHGIVYWDAGDYVRLAIDGGTSGLGFGRPLFLLVSRLVLAIGIEPASAEIVLRWFWTIVGAAAAPAIAVLATRLDLDRRAALAVGAALGLSPSFAHTAHQVLTDAPALALSIVALTAAAGSRPIAAGLFLAAAIATRETAAVHVVAIVLLLHRRSIIAFMALAVALAVTLLALPPPGFAQWFQLMSKATITHAPGMSGVGLSIVWVLATGPAPVIVGLVALLRRPHGRWLLVSVPAAIATVVLLFYPDGSFSPRYVLATTPLAFFLAAGAWLSARPRVMVAALLAPLVVVPFITAPARAMAARGDAVIHRIQNVPADAVVVPGHYCPQARLGATIRARRDLDMICPGWEWPNDLRAVLNAVLESGRPVVLDLESDAWLDPRETPNRDAARGWAAEHNSENVSGFQVVRR